MSGESVLDPSQDADLVRQAMSGRSEAYGDLVRRWAGQIVALCHAQVGSSDAVDDLAQETLLRGMAGLPTLQQPERFGAWLCGIARRVCFDWHKGRRRSARMFVALDEEPSGAALSGHDGPTLPPDEQDASVLMREVEKLPEPYRETLMLYYYNDLSYAELGGMLGVSSATINVRLTRARAMLRAKMMPAEKSP